MAELQEETQTQNKQIIFKNYIEGRSPIETDMELKISQLKLHAPKGSGAVLVKNLYLSCDPYMRGRMREYYDSYIPPFVPGSVRLQPQPSIYIVYCGMYC